MLELNEKNYDWGKYFKENHSSTLKNRRFKSYKNSLNRQINDILRSYYLFPFQNISHALPRCFCLCRVWHLHLYKHKNNAVMAISKLRVRRWIPAINRGDVSSKKCCWNVLLIGVPLAQISYAIWDVWISFWTPP